MSQLPFEGVHMILGNDLAGDKVWADCEPNVVKLPTFPTVVGPSVTVLHLGYLFPACAITHAASSDAECRGSVWSCPILCWLTI